MWIAALFQLAACWTYRLRLQAYLLNDYKVVTQ